jgi:hypothetical protein
VPFPQWLFTLFLALHVVHTLCHNSFSEFVFVRRFLPYCTIISTHPWFRFFHRISMNDATSRRPVAEELPKVGFLAVQHCALKLLKRTDETLAGAAASAPSTKHHHFPRAVVAASRQGAIMRRRHELALAIRVLEEQHGAKAGGGGEASPRPGASPKGALQSAGQAPPNAVAVRRVLLCLQDAVDRCHRAERLLGQPN